MLLQPPLVLLLSLLLLQWQRRLLTLRLLFAFFVVKRGKISSLPLFARRFPLKHAFGMCAAPPRPNRESFSSTSVKELGDTMAQASEQNHKTKWVVR
jgi:hypothetical protein